MSKRKAEDALEPAHPARRPTLHPPPTMGAVHCQPTRDPRQFETCMLFHCQHCTTCLDCQATRDLTWQSDANMRATLSLHNAGLSAKANALDRVAPSFNTTHARMFQLQDQLSALQQQMTQLQQRLPQLIQQQPDNAHEQDGEDVAKSEIMSDVNDNIFEHHAAIMDDDGGAETEEEEYHTPPSVGDDSDDEIALKRQDTPDASTEHLERRRGIVVITAKEQRKARRAIRRIRRREQQDQDSTLRTPPPSSEVREPNVRPPNAGGSVWTEEEDKKLLKGFKKGLSSSQVQDLYLPNRTADAIRKRKGRLQRG